MEAVNLQRVWEIELSILSEIDRVCKKYSLKYSLAYGTLLGAVRHGGFIPWDDDIDIMMPRKDYNRLSEIWEKEAGSQFVIQDKNREIKYDQNFLKIRRDKTAYVQYKSELKKPYHTGIFVDIFPVERKAPGYLARKIQVIACKIDLLYSRGRSSRGKTDLIERSLLLIPKKLQMKIRTYVENVISKWNHCNQEPYFCPCTNKDIYVLFPSDMFDNMDQVSFCGREYMSVNDRHQILTIMYGNYMELPPENERVLTHHPLYVSFESNYEGEELSD